MKLKSARIMMHTVIILVAFLTIYPLFILVASSFKTNIQIYENIFGLSFPLHFEHYVIAYKQIYSGLVNSVIVTCGNIVLTLIISSMAGYAFACFRFPGKNILFFSMMMMMMVPYFLILTPQFIVSQRLGLLNTYLVQILPPSSAFAILSTFLITTHMESLPRSLFEMASIEGAGSFTTFTRIAIPLSKPILVVVTITNTISSWNNYIWPLVAANSREVRPVILAITKITASAHQMPGVNFAGYVLSSIPLMIVFIFATKPFVEGMTAGAVKA